MLRAFYRRDLPHLQRHTKPHFVTFCTYQRWALPEAVRQTALDCCLHDHGLKLNLRVAVIMPDHVHLIFIPQVNQSANEIYSLGEIMDAIKGASAHKINKLLSRTGKVWQTESFDRVLRSAENLQAKVDYILENPVRKGLVSEWSKYPWLWYQEPPNPYSPTNKPTLDRPISM